MSAFNFYRDVMSRQSVRIVVVVLGLFTCVSQAGADDSLEKALGAVFRITNGRSSATCFLVSRGEQAKRLRGRTSNWLTPRGWPGRTCAVGQAVSIPSYPAQLQANDAGWPILRHGTVASYPLCPVEHCQSVLIDFHTFGGDNGVAGAGESGRRLARRRPRVGNGTARQIRPRYHMPRAASNASGAMLIRLATGLRRIRAGGIVDPDGDRRFFIERVRCHRSNVGGRRFRRHRGVVKSL